jgi:hypothetical protein
VKIEDSTSAPSRASATATTSAKKESAETKHRPPSIATATTRNNGRTSKTGTPTAGNFPDSIRPRSGRAINPPSSFGNDGPTKRSHKKGAGLAAQQKAAEQLKQQAVQQDEGASTNAEDDEGDEEPTYCYCGGVSYGEMVACDGPSCPREWFHLDCVGLQKAPKGNGESNALHHRYAREANLMQRNGFVAIVNLEDSGHGSVLQRVHACLGMCRSGA